MQDSRLPIESRITGLQLGSHAPDFEAATTDGPIRFYDWKGERWAVLFSHPSDFTPVCTSEFIDIANRIGEFESRDVAVIGTSVDSIYSHLAWLRSIEASFGVKIPFPIIADVGQEVARLYGMVHEASSTTNTVRTTFIVDPKNKLRTFIAYPMNVGRSIEEILRVIDALQTADQQGVSTPSGWKRGDPVVLSAPTTRGELDRRMAAKDVELSDWYFVKRKLR